MDVLKAQSSFLAQQQSQDLKSPNSILITYTDGSDYLNESSAIEIPALHPTSAEHSQKN